MTTYLITGGTGSLGNALVPLLLSRDDTEKVIIFSRDELKQWEMRRRFGDDRLRFFLGDVRDRARLDVAFRGVDQIIHCASLKQVPACEYNCFEALKTIAIGAMNVIDAAISSGVDKVLALSTDKACAPVNMYGAAKLCSDKMFTLADSYAGNTSTRFSVVRYGNVMSSRGSVIPLFKDQAKTGTIMLTDSEMTRFWITLEEAAQFVLWCLGIMRGQELFVPKIPSMKLVDLARAVRDDVKFDIIGIRPGEKLHEAMIDENTPVRDYGDCYILEPSTGWDSYSDVPLMPRGFSYKSNVNDHWLTIDQMRGMI